MSYNIWLKLRMWARAGLLITPLLQELLKEHLTESAWFAARNGNGNLAEVLNPLCNSSETVEDILPTLLLQNGTNIKVLSVIAMLVKRQDDLMFRARQTRSCTVTPRVNTMMNAIALFMRDKSVWGLEKLPMEYYRVGPLREMEHLDLILPHQIRGKTTHARKHESTIEKWVDTVMKAICFYGASDLDEVLHAIVDLLSDKEMSNALWPESYDSEFIPKSCITLEDIALQSPPHKTSSEDERVLGSVLSVLLDESSDQAKMYAESLRVAAFRRYPGLITNGRDLSASILHKCFISGSSALEELNAFIRDAHILMEEDQVKPRYTSCHIHLQRKKYDHMLTGRLVNPISLLSACITKPQRKHFVLEAFTNNEWIELSETFLEDVELGEYPEVDRAVTNMMRYEIFNGFAFKGFVFFDYEGEPTSTFAPIWNFVASPVVKFFEASVADNSDSLKGGGGSDPLRGSLQATLMHTSVYSEIQELYFDTPTIRSKVLLCEAMEGFGLGLNHEEGSYIHDIPRIVGYLLGASVQGERMRRYSFFNYRITKDGRIEHGSKNFICSEEKVELKTDLGEMRRLSSCIREIDSELYKANICNIVVSAMVLAATCDLEDEVTRRVLMSPSANGRTLWERYRESGRVANELEDTIEKFTYLKAYKPALGDSLDYLIGLMKSFLVVWNAGSIAISDSELDLESVETAGMVYDIDRRCVALRTQRKDDSETITVDKPIGRTYLDTTDAENAEITVKYRRRKVSMLDGKLVVGGLLRRTVHRETRLTLEAGPVTAEVGVGRRNRLTQHDILRLMLGEDSNTAAKRMALRYIEEKQLTFSQGSVCYVPKSRHSTRTLLTCLDLRALKNRDAYYNSRNRHVYVMLMGKYVRLEKVRGRSELYHATEVAPNFNRWKSCSIQSIKGYLGAVHTMTEA